MEEKRSLDLGKINSRYLALKQEMEDEKGFVESLTKELESVEEDVKTLTGWIEEAKRNNDTDSLQQLEAKKKILEARAMRIKSKAEIRKEGLRDLEGKIDKIYENLMQNPELKRHVEQVLAKRLDRQNTKHSKEMKQIEKEKEQESKKIDTIEKIRALVKDHPTMGNYLKGVWNNQAEIAKLLEQKKSLEDNPNKTQDDIQKISDLEKEINERNIKVKKNKQPVMEYINKKRLGISEKDIDDLSNHIVVGKNGQIDIDKTLNAGIQQAKNNIRKKEKAISRRNKKFNVNRQAIINLGEIPTEIEEDSKATEREDSDVQQADVPYDKEDSLQEKPKWWQFIARFKAWRDRRNQKALEEGREEVEPEARKIDTQRGEFADSLKYDVIKGLVDKQTIETQKNAKNVERRDDRESRE